MDTWDKSKGAWIDACELADAIADLTIDEKLSGVTITGGEPLQQPEALAELLKELRVRRDNSIDILVFTGYEEHTVRESFADLAKLVDAFVCGPFMKDLATEDGLVASSNQTVYTPTQLDEGSLADYVAKTHREIQAVVQDGELTFVGIPRNGDLEAIQEKLLERGIEIGGCSWAN